MGELKLRGRIWWIRYNRNGRRYEESSGSKKKTKAITLLQLREGDGAKGLPVTPAIGRFKFSDAVADVVTDYKVNGKRSLAEVERRNRLHLQPYFGSRRMASITTADLTKFISTRQDAKAANAEINRELAIIKRAFRMAMRGGKLLTMPHIPMLREANARQGFFEAGDFEDVRKALPADLQGVVTFGYLTGWRIRSEVLPLTWAQVDRKRKIIRLEPGNTKSGEGRTLPYGDLPALEKVIDAQWKAHQRMVKDGKIVPEVFHRNGKPIATFRKAWDDACKAAGVAGKIPHDLRRTAVRNLVRAGVPEKTAMMITGHKTRSVFDRYDIVNEADMKSALGRLESGTKKGQSERSGRIAAFKKGEKRNIS